MKKKGIPKDFKNIYNRDTCQRCNRPITKERIADCKSRRFWPVCEECEIEIIPKWKKATEMLAKSQTNWFK